MNIRLIGATTALAALTLVGCASTSPGYSPGYSGGGYGNTGSSNYACQDCGVVTRIDHRARGGNTPNATGAVLGGVVGAVAAREIAGRSTDSEGRRNTATVAGAVGGAVAGNAIQNRVQGDSVYDVHVRLDNGRMTVVTQTDLGGIREGSYVRVAGGRATMR
ncbi:glycine zipper 2TM domain-containing protein [Luteimonas sp. MC1782]|uniref:glycine zipper 2TM domain-containing protein n=1 Tax=Luteimonas sp. MC1782 TaxID=2760305 RepID=UPI0015FF2223|nr:glycine zipper 2TM domain-containing protein [Luteimonas sp. MC1782]MBB1472281.1 glycine zipper 2TM domain-containing protein [Luteimonas sp. MC1782]